MSDERDRRRSDVRRSDGRPPQNVKPKLQPEPRRKARRSRSIDSDRGRRRERPRQEERRRRGASEEARRRPRRDGEGERGGTKPPEDEEDEEEEEAECAVCFCSYDNVFKTPKLLACGHTFCLECLARINVGSPQLKTLSCPVCRELTELPHGRDLPRLDTNRDIIGRLPPDMQRALSVRFQRSKGKLLLKNPPPGGAGKPGLLALPVKSPAGAGAGAGAAAGAGEAGAGGGQPDPSAAERGVAQATVVDVGRPPSRVRGRLRRLFRSDRCYYAVVGTIITITVALMLVGILAFVIIPRLGIRPPRPPGEDDP